MNTFFHRVRLQRHRRAFTMIELVMVLVILTALAALLVSLIDGMEINGKSQEQILTETNMRPIRDAIMGTDKQPGAWIDLGSIDSLFPRSTDYLLLEYGNITSVTEYASVGAYDPVTKTGWRGPYLTTVTNLVDGWGNAFVIQVDFDGNNVVDATEARYARLVSAGPDEVFDTVVGDGYIPGDNSPADTEINLAECGDDIVLFFRVPDLRQ